jgi:hypothetical protein
MPDPRTGEAGETPHLTIGNVRAELTPRRTLSFDRLVDPHGRRLTADELVTRRALVDTIAGDPVKQQWLRDYGAALLRAAAAEVLMSVDGPAVEVVAAWAGKYERGEIALW